MLRRPQSHELERNWWWFPTGVMKSAGERIHELKEAACRGR